MEAPARPAPPSRSLIAFLIAITLARLVFAAVTHLTEDEAYYRLWASSLQFGYYDHPPMIAWWIRAGMTLAGDNALGVRLLPALSSGLTSLLVFDLAQRLGASANAGERAAIWFNATLLIGFGGFLATPDAAAVPFWTLTVWCLARVTEEKAARWWIAAGFAAGLACISKYSALFLAPGVLIWLALKPGGWKLLRSPWPWLAGVIALAIFGANVEWNASHHWASFAKQFGRAAPGRIAPQYLMELVLGQILLLNPIIAWFAVRGVAGWRRERADGVDLTLLIATCAPFAAYLVLHSLHDRVQAHWPVPLYPALAIFAAVAAERVSDTSLLKRLAAPLGLGLSALALVHLALPITDIKGLRDPSSDERAWPKFAGDVGALRGVVHAGWIGTLSYGVTGQLAGEHETTVPVAQLNERDRYPPGEQSWRANLTTPGLVVDLDRRVSAAALQRCFAHVTPAGELTRDGTRYAAFAVSGPTRDVIKDGCW